MESYILIIESDNRILELAAVFGNIAGCTFKKASLQEAFRKCRNEECILIIWEVQEYEAAPQMTLKMFRRISAVPIIIIPKQKSSRYKELKLQLLRAGADIYLEEPDEKELVVYIEALIRRYPILDKKEKKEGMPEMVFGPDFLALKNERRAFVSGREVRLTKKEFDIVYYLASKKGLAVSYKELYENVWQEKYLLDDINIMAHIRRIRLKIEKEPGNTRLIMNIYGVGYKFTDEYVNEQEILYAMEEKQRTPILEKMKSEVTIGNGGIADVQKEAIGCRLKECRLELGLTRKEMAENLQYSASAYEEMEDGRREVTINSLVMLEELHGINSRYILTGKETMSYA